MMPKLREVVKQGLPWLMYYVGVLSASIIISYWVVGCIGTLPKP